MGIRKYGLISNKKGFLNLTDAYKSYKLSYNKEEEKKHLQTMFLKPPLFQEILEKYRNVPLPIEILEKALIKEFGVPEKHASRTTTYFINGARLVGLLTESNRFASVEGTESTPESEAQKTSSMPIPELPTKGYSVQIVGPDIDTKLNILEQSDFTILNAILDKIKNKLGLEKRDTSEG